MIWEIIKYVKDILVFKSSGTLNLYNDEELKQIEEISKKTSKERLLKSIYSLSELANDLKMTTQKTIMLEVGIMKLCSIQEGITSNAIVGNTQNSSDNIKNTNEMQNASLNEKFNESNNQQGNPITVSLQNKANELENKIKQLEYKINQISTGLVHNLEQNVDNQEPKSTIRRVNTKTISNGPSNIVTNIAPTGKKSECWGKLVSGLKESGKIMLYTNLVNTTATEVNDMTVGIVFPNGITPFGRSILDKPESVNELTKLVSIEYGKPMQVKYIDAKKPNNNIDITQNISKEMGMPVNIIDE